MGLKLRSLEGEIRYSLGNSANAEIIFREARDGFKDLSR